MKYFLRIATFRKKARVAAACNTNILKKIIKVFKTNMTIENGFLYKVLTKGVVNIFDSAFLFLSFRIFHQKFII